MIAGEQVYVPRTIKRHRRTADEVEQLSAQIIEVLQADHPQSVRHVYYRMTDPRLPVHVEKSDRGYRHVQHRMAELRRAGRLPYGWVTDASRRGYFTNTFSGAGDFIRRMAGLYRADLWAQADCRCEVWVESRSIAGVIEDDCEELAVSLYPAAGFASLSFTYDVAASINAQDNGRPLIVFYIGDYDPAGVLIDRKIEQALREHLDSSVEMVFVRIGITPEQIEYYDLPRKPRNKNDRRALHVAETVEAEAMPACILRRILRERIEGLLPPDALRVAKAAEESERAGLLALAQLHHEERP